MVWPAWIASGFASPLISTIDCTVTSNEAAMTASVSPRLIT